MHLHGKSTYHSGSRSFKSTQLQVPPYWFRSSHLRKQVHFVERQSGKHGACVFVVVIIRFCFKAGTQFLDGWPPFFFYLTSTITGSQCFAQVPNGKQHKRCAFADLSKIRHPFVHQCVPAFHSPSQIALKGTPRHRMYIFLE